MKRTVLIFLFAAGILLSAEDRTPVAVIDLIEKSGVSKDTADMISDYLRTQLVNEEKFIVVSRDNMNAILTEQNFQAAACDTEECMVQAGKLLGVTMLFTGTLGKVGTLFLLNLKMLNVETGEIAKAVSEETKNEEGLLEAVKKIVAEISGKDYKPAASPSMPGDPRTSRRQALQSVVKDKMQAAENTKLNPGNITVFSGSFLKESGALAELKKLKDLGYNTLSVVKVKVLIAGKKKTVFSVRIGDYDEPSAKRLAEGLKGKGHEAWIREK